MLCRLAGLFCLFWASTAAAATSCTVVNLMPDFWQALDVPDAAVRMRAAVITPHPELYNDGYVDVSSGARWAEELAQDRTYVDAHRKEVSDTERYLLGHVRRIMAQFQRTFPDYRCDFPFYVAPSFGRMDGSAAFVQGRHRIIFAPDVIPRYHRLSELRVLIDHETFHIYHHQSTGVFGASAETRPTVLEGLWGEGLATFVSWRMNPGMSLDVAMLQPGIPEGAKPHLAAIAQDLLAHLDEQDEPTYDRYFVAGKQPDGYPPRAGYYVGLLVAQALSAQHTLPQLAHLGGPALRAAVVERLEAMTHAH